MIMSALSTRTPYLSMLAMGREDSHLFLLQKCILRSATNPFGKHVAHSFAHVDMPTGCAGYVVLRVCCFAKSSVRNLAFRGEKVEAHSA